MPVTVDLPLVPPTAIAGAGGVEQMGEQFGSGDPLEAEAAGGGDVGHALLDRGGGDEDLAGPGAAAVLGEEGDALGAQIVELGGGSALVEGAVGAGHLGAAGAQDRGEGEHAAAADPAEEIGFGAGHRAALLGSAGLFKR